MALTKVTGSVIKDSVSLSGNVSVGGTLTYQDVTNVDALGIGTFRTGIKVLAGQVDVGNNIKLGNAGVITATSFSGSGANLTGIQVGGASSLSFNDGVGAFFGNSQDLHIFHDSNNSIIRDNGQGNLYFQVGASNKFNLQSGGVQFYGSLYGDDSNQIELGNDQDLKIYHAAAGISTIGHYHSGGEPLHITSNGDIKFKVAADNGGGGGEDGIIIKSNGAVELYHNNTVSYKHLRAHET